VHLRLLCCSVECSPEVGLMSMERDPWSYQMRMPGREEGEWTVGGGKDGRCAKARWRRYLSNGASESATPRMKKRSYE
jgi:hypothetical protein